MADDKTELEDFDLDEFDFSEFDIKPEMEEDNRTPAKVVKSTAVSSFKDTLGDKREILRAMEDSLPDEYRSTFSAIDTAEATKDQVSKALEPVNKQAKELARNNKKLLQRALPKKLAEKLAGWAEESPSNAYGEIDQRQAEITSSIGDIFRLGEERQSEDNEREKREVERLEITERNDATRHATQLSELSAIRSGVQSQVDYQDQILSRYQQKNLELQYRQFYALSDILDLGKKKAQDDATAFSKMVKNTALPETKKIKYFEEAERELAGVSREHLFQRAGEFSANYGQEFLNNFIQNTTGKMEEMLGGINAAQGITAETGGSSAEMAGGMIGGSLASKALRGGLEYLLRITGQEDENSELRRFGQRSSLFLREAPERLKAWSRRYEDDMTIKSKVINAAKQAAPGYSRMNDYELDLINDADEAVAFTNRVARSITDVIPGYLARQLDALQQLIGGGDSEKVRFNEATGLFETQKDRRAEVEKRLFGSDKENYRRLMDDSIKALAGDDLTDQQKAGMERFLYEQLSRGESVYLKELPNYIQRSEDISEEDREVLSNRVRKNFMDSSGDYYDSPELQKNMERTYDTLAGLGRSIPNLRRELGRLDNAGYRDMLVDMGILGRDSALDQDVIASYLGGRSADKRIEDDTLKASSAVQYRPGIDVRDLGDAGGEDARGDLSTSRDRSTLDTLFGRFQETAKEITGAGSDRVAQAVHVEGERTQTHLNALMEGQKEQIELLWIIGDVMTDPGKVTTSAESGPASVQDTIRYEFQQLRDLMEQCCVKEDMELNNEFLNEIWSAIPESVVMREAMDTNDETFVTRVLQGGRSLAGKGVKALGNYYRFLGRTAKTGVGMGASFLPKAVEKVTSLFSRSKESAKDWYVRGRDKVAIEYNKLIAGEYIDEETGEPVFSKEDIDNAKGNIVDKFGNIVLTVEDRVKGLYTKSGEPVLKKGMDLLMGYYGFLGRKGSAAITAIPKAASFIKEKATGFFNRPIDLYVQGEPTPRLLALLLSKGYYRSQVTGRPILTYKDIDGPVTDPTGKVVLTAEEIALLVDKNGEPIRGLAEKALDLVKGYYGFVWKTTKRAGSMAADLAKGGLNRVRRKGDRNNLADEFSGDCDQCSLWEEQLDILSDMQGMMRDHWGYTDPMGTRGGPEAPQGPQSPASPSKDLVPYQTAVSNQGPVEEPSGYQNKDVVFGMPPEEDLSGYVPQSGASPMGLAGIGGAIGAGIGKLKDSLTNLFQKEDEEDDAQNEQNMGLLSKIHETSEERAGFLEDMSKKQVESQKKTLMALKGIEENTEKEEVNENSWQSILERRKANEGEGDQLALGQGKDADFSDDGKPRSLLDSLVGPFGPVLSVFGDAVGTFKDAAMGLAGFLGAKAGADWLGGGADAADMMDGDRRSSGGKRGGLLSKAWGLTKKAGSFLGRNAVKLGGLAITAAPYLAAGAKAVGAGLAAAGGAIGSVVSAPVILGVAAVAAIGYGGYKLYQYAKGYTPRQLDTMRFAQYGANIGSESRRKQILALESYALDNLSWEDGKPVLAGGEETGAEMLSALGIEENSDNESKRQAATWILNRFWPIFSVYAATLRNLADDEEDFHDMDDLPSRLRLDFAKTVIGAIPPDAYKAIESPFDREPLDFTIEEIRAMERATVDELVQAIDKNNESRARANSANAGRSFPGQEEADAEQRISGVRNDEASSNAIPLQSGRRVTQGSIRPRRGPNMGSGPVPTVPNAYQGGGESKYVLEISRRWQTRRSTISEAKLIGQDTGQTVFSCYFLERPGPDTKESGQRLRIPEGTYRMKWQTSTALSGVAPYLPVPWLYNSQVKDDRTIYIHNGNYPENTDGCLLIGRAKSDDVVTDSVNTLNRFKVLLEEIGIEEVKVKITSNFRGGQAVPRDERTGSQRITQRPEPPSRVQTALRQMPQTTINEDDMVTIRKAVDQANPYKTAQEKNSLVDIEATRLDNSRKRQWLAEQGLSDKEIKDSEAIPNTPQPYGQMLPTMAPPTESGEPAPRFPSTRSPAQAEARRAAQAEIEQEDDLIRQRDEEVQRRLRNQQLTEETQRVQIAQVNQERDESNRRIQTLLQAQLETQRQMSDSLSKLVIYAEDKLEDNRENVQQILSEGNYRPTSQQNVSGYRPPVKLGN